MADGTTLETTPDEVPIQTFQAWIFDVYLGDYPSGLPPDPDGPAWARNRDQIIWTEPLAEGGLYVGYNHILRPAHGDTTTVSSVAKDVSDAMDAGATDPVIVDLRNNPGGDNNTYGLFRSALERYADAAPGTVALLAGRSTFSAAGNFVTDLERGHAADEILLVGEPPGGGPNIYGDVDVVTLPASGIVVLISGRWHEKAPGDPSLEVTPDIPVDLSWADVVAGRDPVLDAAIEATREADPAS